MFSYSWSSGGRTGGSSMSGDYLVIHEYERVQTYSSNEGIHSDLYQEKLPIIRKVIEIRSIPLDEVPC